MDTETDKLPLIAEFWEVYDQYINTMDRTLFPKLSELLSQIENKSRSKHLFRPEKDWNNILAWQVLRQEGFLFPGRSQFIALNLGEIMIWHAHWDRDVFLTRIPQKEMIPGTQFGQYLNPGRKFTLEELEGKGQQECDKLVATTFFADERGLYLPIYQTEVLKKLVEIEIGIQLKNKLAYIDEQFK